MSRLLSSMWKILKTSCAIIDYIYSETKYKLPPIRFQAYKHPEWRGPSLGPRPSEENRREFSEMQLRAGEGVIGLQAGNNKGATQAGQSFGATRKILLGKWAPLFKITPTYYCYTIYLIIITFLVNNCDGRWSSQL